MAGLLAVSLRAPPAYAQPDARPESPSTASPDIQPPRLRSRADVAYPAEAQGDAVVLLELTVEEDGSVAAVRVIEGPEPFASAASNAARAFSFEAARRGGKPVPARIRFQVRFVAPAPTTRAPAASTTPSSRPEPKATPATDSSPDVLEVTVYGEREPSAPPPASLGRAEVREVPGAFGDPFRAIETLPGVTPVASGLPFFYVRGAPPGNVGYFLDGVRVPYLFHIGLGPSVIHPGLVERVDLYPGGYPARFGRFTGGIVAGVTTAPRSDFHGEYNVRLFDLGALAETGFAGDRGTALAAFRYSYTAAALSLFADEIKLDYRDYEARVSYDVTPKDRLTLFSFGSYDLLGEEHSDGLHILYATEFYRLDTRYDHEFAKGSTIRTAVTLGWEQTRIPDQPRNSRNLLAGGRVEISHAASDSALIRGGADVLLEGYRAKDEPYADPEDPHVERYNNMFPPRDDLTLGGWTDVVLRADGVEVTPGVRVDFYRSGDATAVGVDPRIMSRLRVADRVHVLHSFGIAHQPPSFIIPLPGLQIGQLRGGLQTSIQASAGVEVDVAEATTATLTVFENIFLNMTDTLAVLRPGQEEFLREERSQGSAHGVELYLKRRLTRRFGGYLSYTLSRSSRSVGSERFPSGFDRTHVGSAALAYDLGRRWRTGARFMLYTGAPSLPSTQGLIPQRRDEHPDRVPTFYRLDLRLEKRWVLSKSAWIAFVAELMNATLSTEVILREEIGPVTVPSIGVEGGFY